MEAANLEEIDVAVEGLDPVRFNAKAAKVHGVLGTLPRSLHLELPVRLRRRERKPFQEALSAVLGELAKLDLATGEPRASSPVTVESLPSGVPPHNPSK